MKLELFGIFLADAREFAGLTSKQVAEQVGCGKSTYDSWEQGKKWPSFEKMPLLADVLGVTVDDIVEGAGHEYEDLCAPDTEDAFEPEAHFRNIL